MCFTRLIEISILLFMYMEDNMMSSLKSAFLLVATKIAWLTSSHRCWVIKSKFIRIQRFYHQIDCPFCIFCTKRTVLSCVGFRGSEDAKWHPLESTFHVLQIFGRPHQGDLFFCVCPLSKTKQQQQQSSTIKLIHSYNEIWNAFVCRQPMMKSKQLWRQPLKAQVKADTWDIQMKRLCQVISLETLTPAFLMPKLGFLLVQPL